MGNKNNCKLSGVKTNLKSKALPIINSTISNDFCELIYEVLILGYYASVTSVGILTIYCKDFKWSEPPIPKKI